MVIAYKLYMLQYLNISNQLKNKSRPALEKMALTSRPDYSNLLIRVLGYSICAEGMCFPIMTVLEREIIILLGTK